MGEAKEGWFARLKKGLGRSTNKIVEGITALVSKRKLDAAALESLEEILISADLGPATAARLVAEFGKNRFGKEVSDTEVKDALAEQISAILKPCAVPLTIETEKKPFVAMIVGVNGTGKTTTIGKLAQFYKGQGKSVMLAAGDTFRAAACAQLKIWGERTGCEVVSGAEASDAAALGYQALEKAQKNQTDLLLVDTAGRLHNKKDLMQELAKMARVLKKLDETAPHAVVLILDATTGQNAHAQVDVFREIVSVTGLIVTKLDGSARGGVVVALADKTKLPIYAIGVGEGADDLRPFDPVDYARLLVGAE